MIKKRVARYKARYQGNNAGMPFTYDKTLTAQPKIPAYCHVHQNAVDQCFHEFFPLNEQVDGSVTRHCPTSFRKSSESFHERAFVA